MIERSQATRREWTRLAAGVFVLAIGCSSEAVAPDGDGAGDASADAGGPTAVVFGDRVARRQFPALQAGATGVTAPIAFALPAETLSVTVVTEAADGRLAVARWRDGGGQNLVDEHWLSGPLAPWLCTQGCVFRQQSRPFEQALLAPNAPRPATLAGVHELRALHQAHDQGKWLPASGQVRVELVAVRGPALAAGRLPVNLCLTGALGWNAKNAPVLPRLQQAIADATQILAQVGIQLSVAVHDVAGAAPLVEHSSEDNELRDLFATGAQLPLGVNVFLVEQVYVATGGVQSPIAGISGGIPGPPLRMGTAGAGIAVSLALGPGEDDRLGLAIAHELGHFLGLYHTSEAQIGADPALHDDLGDTPGDGEDNLMYWAPQAGATKLSAEQGQILRSSAWLQPIGQ
ncbi:MAG: hypothetical protein HY902_19930 [Deltaproteobacteria bacterium]|nr:hypothetical protein [Deltaproteobacteria bacterium]